MSRDAAPAEVAALILGLHPDVADLIATESKGMAEMRVRDGVAISPDDEETASEMLGRRFTRREALALEACISHYAAEIEADDEDAALRCDGCERPQCPCNDVP